MVQVPIEELVERCGSIYKLVILAAKRAKALTDGAPSLVQTPIKKVTSLALEEILQGKVVFKAGASEEGAQSRGRTTKAKKEQKASRA